MQLVEAEVSSNVSSLLNLPLWTTIRCCSCAHEKSYHPLVAKVFEGVSYHPETRQRACCRVSHHESFLPSYLMYARVSVCVCIKIYRSTYMLYVPREVPRHPYHSHHQHVPECLSFGDRGILEVTMNTKNVRTTTSTSFKSEHDVTSNCACTLATFVSN